MEPLRTSLAQLIAVIPRQLGYLPTDRIAVVALDAQSQLLATCSADATGEDAAHLFAAQAHAPLVAQGAASYIVVAFEDAASLRHELATVAADLSTDQTTVVAALRVAGGVIHHQDGSTENIPELPEALTSMGAQPTGDREATRLSWLSIGGLAAADHGLDPIAAWCAILNQEATPEQIEQAAHAATDVTLRDAIIFALTPEAARRTDDHPAQRILDTARSTPDIVEALRAAVSYLDDGPDAVPMLTVVLIAVWTRGSVGHIYLADRLIALDAARTHRLASLVLTAIAHGANPARLRNHL
ncbi:hypothetical protein [Allobranchiibius huperziae]|uniref:DUF4192 family protein n=1 Tax=Allobranchiibius huperziae TaxID=1874116 RepID=A0A853DIG1_9MICO|nr:hypothetical protein [Allobranchiibius huperziae]NYJ76477.1 hypothetical protein [Allobranchiibius huperziae]